MADQLQTNFASDLRNILKCVFELHVADMELSSSKSDKNRLPTIDLPQQGECEFFYRAGSDECRMNIDLFTDIHDPLLMNSF